MAIGKLPKATFVAIAVLVLAAAGAGYLTTIETPFAAAAAACVLAAAGLWLGRWWGYVLAGFAAAPGGAILLGGLLPTTNALRALAVLGWLCLFIIPLGLSARAFFPNESDRTYLGRFTFIFVVCGLFALAWGLKGTELGQDLAGGAELRYGVTKRLTELYQKYLQWKGELSDPEREAEKRRRLAEIERELETATDAQKDRLRHEKAELELALDPVKLAQVIEDLERQQESVAQGAEIVRRRLDPTTTADIEVRTVGSSQILIRIPYQRRAGESEAEAESRFKARLEEIQSLVERQGVLRFHLAVSPEDHADQYEEARRRMNEGRAMPPGRILVLPEEQYEEVAKKLAERGIKDPLEAGYIKWAKPLPQGPSRRSVKREHQAPLLLEATRDETGRIRGVLDGTIVDRAHQRFREKGWEIALDFTASGGGQFERVSAANVKRQLAIVLDEVCHSAPVIQERISGGSAVITGNFTESEAKDLATVLTAGSLPVQIQFESKSVVGPSLGRDTIRAGVLAFIVGSGAVFVFMILYYLAGGTVACVGLVLNLLLLVGVLAAFNIKLTLPGIAGILLTVGMAVDANVLIFERIREEKSRGRTLRLAIQAGFDRAFVTIIDANVTTILTALILYWFGSGPIRGFAISLTVGIAASLFTALYVSRAIIEFLANKGWISEFAMMSMVGRTSIPFMKLRPLSYALSLLLVGGSIYAFTAHKDKWGIDFVGGTMLQVKLKEPIPDDRMRQLADSAMAAMQARERARAKEQNRDEIDFGSVRTQAVVRPGEPRGASSQYSLMMRLDVHQLEEYKSELAKNLEGLLDETHPFPSQESIGQTVSEELGSDAVRALIFSVILIFIYIVLRFEFNPSFGVGAVAALIHDTVITTGALAAADWAGLIPAKFDLTTVAAVLTILGYSLNDTIVVFDRIREFRAQDRSRPMGNVIDDSVNSVLSRTLITSLTTLFTALALLFLGGDATKGFAFAMVVGVTVGTFSSVFIASPIVMEWERLRQHKRLKTALAIAAGVLVVLGAVAFVAQMVRTERESRRREECRRKIEDLRLALRSYAARHDGAYPPRLETLAEEGYLRQTSALWGLTEGPSTGYSYVSGLRSDDPADCVLVYDPPGAHAFGLHALFVDGRVAWMDARRIEASVANTANKIGALPQRKIDVIPAGSPRASPVK